MRNRTTGGNVLGLKNARAHTTDFDGVITDNRTLVFEGGREVIREVADTIVAAN
jgi:3-deoxy-D-manno-octulosonate 8-phosphate phosphatase KdsC-like HAD superfamily phosphatase